MGFFLQLLDWLVEQIGKLWLHSRFRKKARGDFHRISPHLIERQGPCDMFVTCAKRSLREFGSASEVSASATRHGCRGVSAGSGDQPNGFRQDRARYPKVKSRA